MYYFILNPASGSYSISLEEQIKEKAKEILQSEFAICYTKLVDGLFLPDLTRGLNSGDTLVAVGGDGTLNNCLNYLHKHNLTQEINLAIIPRGTGNNMLKALKLSKNVDKAMKIIKQGNKISLQYGLINEKTTFFNCSIGFSAFLLTNRHFKSRNGYFLDIVANIFKFKAEKSTIATDGSIKQKHFFYGFFINTTHYASIIPFLKQNSADGKIRFFHSAKLSLVKNLYRFVGFLLNNNGLKEIVSDQFEFIPGKNSLLEIDGDIVSPAEKYNIRFAGRVEVIGNL